MKKSNSTNPRAVEEFELPVDLQELEEQLRQFKPVEPTTSPSEFTNNEIAAEGALAPQPLNPPHELLEFEVDHSKRLTLTHRFVTAVSAAWVIGAAVGALGMFLLNPAQETQSRVAEREASSEISASDVDGREQVANHTPPVPEVPRTVVSELPAPSVSWLTKWVTPRRRNQSSTGSSILRVRGYESIEQWSEAVPAENPPEGGSLPRLDGVELPIDQRQKSQREILNELMRSAF